VLEQQARRKVSDPDCTACKYRDTRLLRNAVQALIAQESKSPLASLSLGLLSAVITDLEPSLRCHQEASQLGASISIDVVMRPVISDLGKLLLSSDNIRLDVHPPLHRHHLHLNRELLVQLTQLLVYRAAEHARGSCHVVVSCKIIRNKLHIMVCSSKNQISPMFGKGLDYDAASRHDPFSSPPVDGDGQDPNYVYRFRERSVDVAGFVLPYSIVPALTRTPRGSERRLSVLEAAGLLREHRLDTILVVDRSLLALADLQDRILQAQVCDKIITSRSLAEAVTLCSTSSGISLVLLDADELLDPHGEIERPGDTATWIGPSATLRTVPIVVTCAADFLEGQPIRAIGSGADAVLSKPFSTSALLQTINLAVDSAHTDHTERPAPRGSVALVFTDVVSSTRLWAQAESSMAVAIEMHNSIARMLVKKHHGFEVKTEGDAFFLSFDRPEDAVAFCTNFRQALVSADWPAQLLELDEAAEVCTPEGHVVRRGLQVRAGIHVGEPRCAFDPVMQRTDYLGPVVNMAARVSAQATAGQIVCSGEVAIQLPPDQVRYMQPVPLKGIEQPVELYEVL